MARSAPAALTSIPFAKQVTKAMWLEALSTPPVHLASLTRSAATIALPAIEYHLPASLHPLLLVVWQGKLAVQGDAAWHAIARLSLCGPTRSPHRVRASRDTRLITVSNQSGQLSRLFDANALAISNACLPLDSLCDPSDRAALRHCESRLETTAAPQQAMAALWALLSALSARRAQRAGDLVVPTALMASTAPSIAGQLGVGLRQFERRFAASYGQPVRGYRQQLRFSQALSRLLDRADAAATLATLALDGGYCDQSHWHRDITRFTGLTPGQLTRGIQQNDPALWPYLSARQHALPLFGPTGH